MATYAVHTTPKTESGTDILELQTRCAKKPVRTSSAFARTRSKMTAKVSLEDVERVADLAHLKLTSDETQSMLHDLNAILDYVAQLNELDTDSVAPLAQVNELEGAGGVTSLRNDLLQPSLDRAVVMPEAPDSNGAFFKVPKVIER